MQTGIYSRLSIILAALAGMLCILAGLILLYRDAARRSADQDNDARRAPLPLNVSGSSGMTCARTGTSSVRVAWQRDGALHS